MDRDIVVPAAWWGDTDNSVWHFLTEDDVVGAPARDYEKILDLALAVLDSPDVSAAWDQVVRQLVAVLPGEVGWMYEDIDLARNTGRPCAWSAPITARLLETRLAINMPDHPLARHLAATGDPTPVTLHDVISEGTWRHNPVRSSLKVDFGITRQLMLSVPPPALRPGTPPTWRVCLISRSGRDFTQANREFAGRLQPVLVRLDRHLTELHRLRTVSGTFARPEQKAVEVGLTPRELTVLALLARGLTADTLARHLGISRRTAVKHLENIYRKWGTSDRLTTVLLAQKIGLVP